MSMRASSALERTRRLHATRTALATAYAALDEAAAEYQLAARTHDRMRLAVADDRLYAATEAVYAVLRAALLDLSLIADRPPF